jgi:hypothetical protein
MSKVNKYTYYKVIQECWSGTWEDVDFYETDSHYYPKTKEDREAFKVNLKAYRENSSVPVRVIKRKELNEVKG